MSLNVSAAEDSVQAPVIPEPLMDGQSIEPDVNIIQKKDRTIQEYRMNGKLYMIKVTPSVGLTLLLDGYGWRWCFRNQTTRIRFRLISTKLDLV